MSDARVNGRLDASILALSDLVENASEIASSRLRYVTWELRPSFATPGRTAWQSLRDSIKTNAAETPVIRALKLKGVGQAGSDGPPVPPPLGRFSHKRPHVGVTDDGELTMLWPERTPVGGIFLDRAELEFVNSERLCRVGCPSIVPIALYKYKSLKCDWRPARPLGAVLTGSPNRNAQRANVLFDSDDEVGPSGDEFRRLLNCFSSSGCRYQAVERLAFEYGRTLREFHEAGLFRHNANPVNLLVDPDSLRVALIDLDSSRLLEDCTDARRPIEILRDIAGGFYNFVAVTLYPRNVHLFPPGEFEAGRLGDAMMEGYFGTGHGLEDRFCPVVEHMVNCQAVAYGQRESAISSGLEPTACTGLDQAFIFGNLMSGLVEQYVESSLGRRISVQGRLGEVIRTLAGFQPVPSRPSWSDEQTRQVTGQDRPS